MTDYYEEPKSFMPKFFGKVLKNKKSSYKEGNSNEKDFEVLNSLTFNKDYQINMNFDLQDANLNEVVNESFQDDSIKQIDRPSKLKIYFKRYNSFITSPKVHFFYDTFFYIIFLLLFSYMILCDFNYYVPSYEFDELEFKNTGPNVYNSSDEALIDTSFTAKKEVQSPYAIEYVLIFWIVTYTCEEFNQVLKLISRNFKSNQI